MRIEIKHIGETVDSRIYSLTTFDDTGDPVAITKIEVYPETVNGKASVLSIGRYGDRVGRGALPKFRRRVMTGGDFLLCKRESASKHPVVTIVHRPHVVMGGVWCADRMTTAQSIESTAKTDAIKDGLLMAHMIYSEAQDLPYACPWLAIVKTSGSVTYQ